MGRPRKKKPTWPLRIEWVVEVLGQEKPKNDTILQKKAPDASAWALYCFAKKNEADFWNKWAIKLLPKDTGDEEMRRRTDDGGSLTMIGKIERLSEAAKKGDK